jgi:threonine dehydrogenase-like Zn-dependent dehydrogenase
VAEEEKTLKIKRESYRIPLALGEEAVPTKEKREQEEEKHMRATVYHGPGDMRIDQVPDPIIEAPTDVVARMTHAGICGSDLWPYRGIDQRKPGDRMGHEWMGMVEEVGAQVRTLKKGDRVISPFLISDGTCEFCREGLPSLMRAWRALGRSG